MSLAYFLLLSTCQSLFRSTEAICFDAEGQATDVSGLENAGFELATGGWVGLQTSHGKSTPSIKCNGLEAEEICESGDTVCTHSQRDAPPEGSNFATVAKGDDALEQNIGATFVAGQRYRLRAWARGVNPSWGGAESSVVPVTAGVQVTVALLADDEVVASTKMNVGAPVMKGSARSDNSCAKCHQDDGANVFFDGDYRVHVGQNILYQKKSADPIADPWQDQSLDDFDGMAHGPIVTTQGLKALITTWYQEEPPVWSKMSIHNFGGDPPAYSLDGLDEDGQPTEEAIILQNSANNEQPWVIDAQLFQDPDTSRLWIVWGGHETWISELDPFTGKVCCTPSCSNGTGVCATNEFADHASGVHTKILSFDDLSIVDNEFQGDGCGQRYMEGPGLYKYQGLWFIFSSWGSMGEDYTIRVCRSTDVRGPYVDKDGRSCVDFLPDETFPGAASDTPKGTYGSSMLLGPEGEQSVPGHAHIWEEGGVTYMGYDFRKGAAYSDDEEGTDYMAIRKLHWIEDPQQGWWPTIWQPVDAIFEATSEHAGKEVGISLSSTGSEGSIAAFDLVSLAKEPVDDAECQDPIQTVDDPPEPTPDSADTTSGSTDSKTPRFTVQGSLLGAFALTLAVHSSA